MKVCIVCLGNICRSPMAEVVLREALEGLDVEVDSAGMNTGHAGQPMDPRAFKALAGRGFDGSAHRARQFRSSWDRALILAMDNGNINALYRVDRLGFLYGEDEIPDPFFGNEADFDRALDMIIAATPAIVSRISDMLGE